MTTCEINIYEPIGRDFFGEGITAKDVAAQLAAAGKPSTVVVNINSPGGIVSDGQAIYNVLTRSGAHVVVNVDGMAASAASVVAMAGDEINMAENAVMMVHDAWGMTQGPAADHTATASKLDIMSNTISGVYAARTGKTADECRALMKAESWFDAKTAVALGFATKVTPAKALPQASWEGSTLLGLYKNAPSAPPAAAPARAATSPLAQLAASATPAQRATDARGELRAHLAERGNLSAAEIDAAIASGTAGRFATSRTATVPADVRARLKAKGFTDAEIDAANALPSTNGRDDN